MSSGTREGDGRTKSGIALPTISSSSDPVVWWLYVAIYLVVVSTVVAVLYGLLVGAINPSSPRTAVEARLLTLKNAAKTLPGSGSARRDYILALYDDGQTDEALAQVAQGKADLTGIERTEVYVAQLGILDSQKRYDEVLAVANEALTYDQAARRAIIAGEVKKGLAFTEADLPQTASINILVFKAKAQSEKHDYAGAVDSYTRALSRDPESADLLVARGNEYARMGEKSKALADFKAALQFVPGYAPAIQGQKQVQSQ